MGKMLPLAGIGCVAILVLALIVGGGIMLFHGISGYIKKKDSSQPNNFKKVWVVPENERAHFRLRGDA
jgi:hypothetical protein